MPQSQRFRPLATSFLSNLHISTLSPQIYLPYITDESCSHCQHDIVIGGLRRAYLVASMHLMQSMVPRNMVQECTLLGSCRMLFEFSHAVLVERRFIRLRLHDQTSSRIVIPRRVDCTNSYTRY